MSRYLIAGGSTDPEGIYKFLLHFFKTGYSRGLNVSQRASGANMSVDVNLDADGLGGGLLATSALAPYFGYINANENVAANTANPTNPRNDIVVMFADISSINAAVTNNLGAFKFAVISGTAATSPTDPSDSTIQTAVGSSNPWRKLARIVLPAAAPSVVNAYITDLRTPAALAVPYLWGGASNTKGHLVPNHADGTLVTTADTNSVNGTMLATSAIELGYAQAVVATTGITSEFDIAGLSATVTVPPGGRDIRITVELADVGSSVGSQRAAIQIKEGSTALRRVYQWLPNTSGNTVHLSARVPAPSAGVHTYKATISRDVGGGTVSAYAAGVPDQSFILVEAI